MSETPKWSKAPTYEEQKAMLKKQYEEIVQLNFEIEHNGKTIDKLQRHLDILEEAYEEKCEKFEALKRENETLKHLYCHC